MIEWRFPSNDNAGFNGINHTGIAMFRGTPVRSLAREICQNSIDAARDGEAVVEFKMFKIPSEKIPGRDQLLDAFNRCLQYESWEIQEDHTTKDFFKEAVKKISSSECSILRISDFKTTGLTGSKKKFNSDWTNLTKSSGVSDKNGTAGGSYGIGKFAPFACSHFSTVFYSTYDIDGTRASQGVARLVTFTREDGEDTQGVGYFGDEKNTPVYEELYLDPDFKRKDGEYGTDIYIAGYNGDESWKKELVVSILDSFLGAIWKGKLEVIIDDIIINKNELDSIIEIYRSELTGYTDKYYKVLTSNETVWCRENFLGIADLGEVELGILIGEQDSPNKISMIRQTGMKIMDKGHLPGHVPFTGVMFINGQGINKQLREMENPEHTEWQPKRTKNPVKARQLIKSLTDYIKSKIEELINSGSGESVDAAGVGNFLPDDAEESSDMSREETVTDKVLDIEVKKVTRKSSSSSSGIEKEVSAKGDIPGHKEPGGDDKEWFHNGGNTDVKGERPGQDAHFEPSGSDKMPSKVRVGVDKFICMCVSKNDGKYMLKVVPADSGSDGVIELFLSAETQKYEAPLKNVNVIKGKAHFSGNKIEGLTFVKGQEIRMSIDLDYYDYCSMEVVMYAAEK